MSQTDVAWIYHRPVRHGLARSAREVRREWTIAELYEAHQALDVEADIEIFAERESRRKSGNKR